MDKNKIHIDEFVRNMLSDREEEKPAGAWGGMRQLLDQAMPVAGTVAGAAFNWKRFLGIASAVVVISGLSLSGYQLMDDSGNNGGKGQQHSAAVAEAAGTVAEDQNSAQTTLEGGLPASTSGSSNGMAALSGSSGETETAPAAATSGAAHRAEGMSKTSGFGAHSVVNPSAGTSSASLYVDGQDGHPAVTAGRANGISAASAVAGRTGAVSSNRGRNAANGPVTAGRRNTTQQLAAVPATAGTNGATAGPGRAAGGTTGRQAGTRGSTTAAPASVQVTGISSAHASRPDNGSDNNGNASVARVNRHGNAPASNGAGRSGGTRSTTQPGGMTTGGAQRSTGSGNTASSNLPLGSGAAQPKNVVTDNIIELRQYLDLQSRAWKLDTIGTYQRQRPVSKPDAEEPQIAPQRRSTPPRRSYGPNPDATAYLPAAGSPLAQTSPKTAGRKSSDMYEKEGGISLTATIDRTRSAFSQIRWQPGLVGSLDASFGRNSFFGFQAGFSSLFLVNEQWSFGLEARYNRLANRGAVVKDDYLSTVEAGINRWTEDTVSHFFSFPSLQAIQLPLFVRREIGRFFALAGANLTYAFSVNAEEREQRRGTTTIITGYLPPNTNIGMQRSPGVVYQDFNQRFGFGYVLGAGYAISPALQTDVRLTQMVWDNAAGKGAQRVSKELYRAPAVQLSISYRFNTNRD